MVSSNSNPATCSLTMHITEGIEALECLQILLEAVPPNVHLMSPRARTSEFPWAAPGAGQVLELRADDLRFSAR